MDSFDVAVLLKKMRTERSGEDIFIQRSVGGKLLVKPEDRIKDGAGFLMIIKKERDVAININHIVSIFTRGDL